MREPLTAGFLLCCAFIGVLCPTTGHAQAPADSLVADSTQLGRLVNIHPERPALRLQLFLDEDGAFIGTSVYRSDTDRHLQQLVVPADFAREAISPHEELDTVHVADLNFDGYRDLGITRFYGSAGAVYSYWLYNPLCSQFEFSPALSTLCDVRRDTTAQYIEGCCRGGGNRYKCQRYHPAEQSMQLVRTENQRPAANGSGILRTIKERSGDSLRVVCRLRRVNGRTTILEGSEAACFDQK